MQIELATTTDASTISFNLNIAPRGSCSGLTTPELTIEPGAVQGMFGNLIDGTFDVSTASYNGDAEKFSVSSQDTEPYGIAFSNDGTKMFVVGDDHNNINQYALSPPLISLLPPMTVMVKDSPHYRTPLQEAWHSQMTAPKCSW